MGTPHDVVLVGTKAYVASEQFGLSIVDVSTPSAPVVLSRTIVPFEGLTGLGVSGNTAFLNGGVTGAHVVDVTSSSAPVRTAQINTTTLGGTSVFSTISGTTGYVLVSIPGNPGHTDLVTVNLATPTNPVILGRTSMIAGLRVHVIGTTAYVAAGLTGLILVDVTNPASPTPIAGGTVDTPGTAADVAVSGNFAYVADTTSIQVVDISTPGSSHIVGTGAFTALEGVINGTKLYTVDGGTFRILDISSPPTVTSLGSATSFGAQGIATNGTTAFLPSPNISGTQGGLYAYNVTTPATPVVLSQINDYFGSAGIAVGGNLVLASGIQGSTLKVVNIGTPTAPTTAASMLKTTFGGNITAVGISGTTGYAAASIPGNPGHTRFFTLDLTTPSAPTVLGQTDFPAATSPQAMKVAGSLAYVADASTGLFLVNVATPSAPVVSGSVDTPGNATDVCVSGSFAFIMDTSSIQVANVSNPSAPVLSGPGLAQTATICAINGTKLYTVNGSTFSIIDISTPTSPLNISTTSGYGSVRGVAVIGNLVYLATPAALHSDLTSGVYVLDVSTPTLPAIKAHFQVPSLMSLQATNGTNVFGGDPNAVVDVYH